MHLLYRFDYFAFSPQVWISDMRLQFLSVCPFLYYDFDLYIGVYIISFGYVQYGVMCCSKYFKTRDLMCDISLTAPSGQEICATIECC